VIEGRLVWSAAAIVVALAWVPPALAVSPGSAPSWSINSLAVPTNFEPGGEGSYEVTVSNNGGAPADGNPLTITDTLPAGLTVEGVELPLLSAGKQSDFGPSLCKTEVVGEAQVVTCTVPSELPGSKPALLGVSEALRMIVHVAVPGGASGPLINAAQIEGGGAPLASATSQNEASSKPALAGFQEFRAAPRGVAGQLAEQAGSHPYQYTTSFAINTNLGPPSGPAAFVPAEGDVKDIEVKLPPGFVGDPTATPLCTVRQFNTVSNKEAAHPINECPDSAAVGLVLVQQLEGEGTLISAPLYNLVPPKGMPAQLGFQIASLPFYINTSLRTGSDYGISAQLQNTSQLKRVTAASVTVWGVPANESHDPLRGHCLNSGDQTKPLSLDSCKAGVADEKPFLRLPTSCEDPLAVEMSFNIWTDPGAFQRATSTSPAPSGCNLLDWVFPREPSLEARPTTNVADSPSGLTAHLHIPQNNEPEGLGEADVRKAVVTLPKGLVINPSGANGLEACSSAQIELHGPQPARCPDGSKIGTVEVKTPLLKEVKNPLLDHPLFGSVYVAMPHDNPFDSLLAIYIAVDDPQTGVVVKLAGHVQPDPQTGQLTTTFDENPQLPFEDFKLDFFGGALAPLRTPATCGTYSTTSEMTPWSAPESGPPATPSDTYAISQGANGSACASSEAALPNSPAFDAGTIAPIASAYSPFVVHLRREDGSQEFASLTVTTPPGLLGKLAGIPYCPESALAAAAAKPGNGEKASPSCPAASQVGVVDVGAGAGPAPFYAQGKAYLTGPYKGAPLSLAIVTPAAAGPYDLGTVVVRTALYVNPETAQITAKSDPIPSILQGIPLDVRTIAVKIDRPNFTLNPTNCDPLAIGGLSISTLGQPASLASRFQVAECGRLSFAPKLSTRLFGKTNRGAHPKFRAVLRMPQGGANIARAAVTLPHSEFLDQGHIRTICTRVQFAVDACPEGSIYGYAVAKSPLLDEPLRGPVYLRSSSHNLPDLVIALRGQVEVELAGRVDSVRGGIRTTFEAAPDAPVSTFVLTMKGGSKGLLQNSTNICRGEHRVSALFDGQNGKVHDISPLLQNSRCAAQRRAERRHQHQHRRAAPHRLRAAR